MLIRFGAKVELACIYSEQGEEQDDSELARVAKAELVHQSETAQICPFFQIDDGRRKHSTMHTQGFYQDRLS